MKIVLLAGAPGSGKSTQGAALMAMDKHFKHLALGEVVRLILKDPAHPITKQYQALISQGYLLQDEVIKQILSDELAKFREEDSIILLDGYPRTHAQYENFKESWGMPEGLIHLDVEASTLRERILGRGVTRADDNDNAIDRRLNFYQQTTCPLLDEIKRELPKKRVIVSAGNSINTTSVFLYAQLQRIETIHALLANNLPQPIAEPSDNRVKSVGLFSMMLQWWQTGIEYGSIRGIQDSYQTKNFSFSALGRQIVYLETAEEVKKILKGSTKLGPVYRHFSLAADLKYDFVATNAGAGSEYFNPDQTVNIWKLIHTAFGMVMKEGRGSIERLMDKHLDKTFFSAKTFDLDTSFDEFFTGFWSDYLFGKGVSAERYQENRQHILAAMKQCFYSNYYKSLDPTGLSSWLYRYPVHTELMAAKNNIQSFIGRASADSMIARFKSALHQLNARESLGLEEETIVRIVADCTFDLIFEPDFLENVMYEALAQAIKENADLRDAPVRKRIYEQGMHHGYLFPIRSRILEEAVQLDDGSVLPAGTMAFINLKNAGIYHSDGPRRCVGQAFTSYFKEHFFNRIQAVEFKVKGVSEPGERQEGNENVPMSPERYTVSWKLRRDEAMRHLTYHNYKGKRFFDVLKLHQHPDLNNLMVRQAVFKIQKFVEENKLDGQKIAITVPEMRGIPFASQVAKELNLPLYIIRKKDGYKMAEQDVYRERIVKGYGDEDVLELPVDYVTRMADTTLILLDDGIASGESAEASAQLIEKNSAGNKDAAKVGLVIGMLQHDYVQANPKLSQHRLVRTLFDCRSKAAELDTAGHNSTHSL